MELRKKVEMTLKDYQDFNFRYIRNRTIIIPILTIAVIVVITLMDRLSVFGNDWADIFSTRLIVCYALLLAFPLISILILRYAAKKQYESNKLMRSETEIILSEAGVSETGKYVNTSVAWADLYKIEESKSAFYFYIAKGQAVILPKRILENGEAAAVRTLIAEYTAPGR